MADQDAQLDNLFGYLAGNFADSDLAGLTDEEAAVEGLSRTTLDWYRSVLREGRAALDAPHFDWRRVAEYANRAFTSERQTREWLVRMMDALQRGIEKL